MTIASIDIGTNTVLLLIAQINPDDMQMEVIFEDQKIPRIGKGLKYGTPISEAKINLLLEILALFKKSAQNYNCKKILVTATNAFRIASNQMEIIEKINTSLQLEVTVISGKEEARLTFLGALFDLMKDETYAVIDIGGGSTEIIIGTKDKIHTDCSLPLGVVSLTEKYFQSNPPIFSEIENLRIDIHNQLSKMVTNVLHFHKVIAVAGTPTTLACIKKGLVTYNESLIEGEILTHKEIKSFANNLSTMSSEKIKEKFHSIVDGREDVLLAGAILLDEIMCHIHIKEVIVTAKGVRYGAIYDFLNNLKVRGFE